LSKFSPNSIKPKNDFYDYINYQWLKNVSLEQQQKYIVQIDDFRLAQDTVYRQLNEIILEYIKNHDNKLSKNQLIRVMEYKQVLSKHLNELNKVLFDANTELPRELVEEIIVDAIISSNEKSK
jgi:hypothetical protein